MSFWHEGQEGPDIDIFKVSISQYFNTVRVFVDTRIYVFNTSTFSMTVLIFLTYVLIKVSCILLILKGALFIP